MNGILAVPCHMTKNHAPEPNILTSKSNPNSLFHSPIKQSFSMTIILHYIKMQAYATKNFRVHKTPYSHVSSPLTNPFATPEGRGKLSRSRTAGRPPPHPTISSHRLSASQPAYRARLRFRRRRIDSQIVSQAVSGADPAHLLLVTAVKVMSWTGLPRKEG